MGEWLLAVPPLARALAFHALILAMGWPVIAGLWGRAALTSRLPRWSLALVASHGLGLAMVGWLASLLGVRGHLTLGAFFGAVSLWLLGAYAVAGRSGVLVRGRIGRRRQGIGNPWMLGVGLGILGLLVGNIVLGGFHHDMHQDPLWYHLSLPGQWALTGRLEIFPWAMNSVMPLSSEAFTTILLLAGDGVTVTVFYAVATCWLCVAMPWLAWDLMGRAGAWAGLIFALMVASLCAVVPIPSKNDNLAALHMLAAGVLVWEVQLRLVGVGRAGWLSFPRLLGFSGVTGYLVAASVTSKLTSAPLIAPVVLAALILVAVFRGRQWAGVVLAAGFGGGLALLPFLIRNLPLGISPLHPVGAGWFPGNTALEPALRISATHEVYPLSVEGLLAMLGDLPEKVHLTLASRDIVLPVLVIALGLGCMAWRRPPLLVALMSVGGGLLAFAWMKGFNNIGRYLITAYPLALPLVAWMGRELLRQTGFRKAVTVGVVMLVMGIQIYASKQAAWAGVWTIRWGFWPELSLARAREVAAFREKGPFYLILTEARDHIPGDARLLLPDIVYPFYLERRAIWADELSDPLLPGWFGDNQPEEWARQLEEYGITHVLMQWPQMAGGVNQTLVEQCRLEEIAANRAKPGKAGWILYRFPGRSPKE